METETIFIYAHCKDNKELDFDGYNKLYIISLRLGYCESKWDKYKTNQTKYKTKTYVVMKGIKCLEQGILYKTFQMNIITAKKSYHLVWVL